MILKNITKIYHNKNNDVEALKEINLDLNNDGITTILGPSGCGKTTMLHIISRQDKNYTGKLIGNEKVEIIEQEFMLFESMSVLDNLLIISDKVTVLEYLRRFNLTEQKNKKVKKLSNGQKKRIQIIRSLLMQPDMLLCDEPTASLDHENRTIVMEMLKEISQKCIVILVTHETDIAEMYSDRIITIDNGEIEKDIMIHEVKEHEPINQQKKDISIKDNIIFLYKHMKSRVLSHILNIFLIFCIIFGLFVSMNMFETAKIENEKDISTYYNQNIVGSTPYQEYDQYWIEYDTFTYQQIQDIVNEIPEIQGYTFGHNIALYSYENFGDFNYETGETVFKRPKTPSNQLMIDENGNDISSRCIYWSPSIPYVQLLDPSSSYESDFYDYEYDPYYSLIYQMTKQTELDLLYGRQCKEDNEMVVDYNIAQQLCNIYKIKNMEDLIGKEFSLYMFMGYGNEGVQDPEWKMKVSGILNGKSIYENQIFVCDHVWMNMLSSMFHIDEELWYFQFVDFIIDPTSHMNEVVEKINDVYKGKDSHFDFKDYEGIYWYNYRRNVGHYSKVKPQVDTSALVKMSLIAISIVFVLYTIIDCISLKRRKKENHLMKTYGYSYMFVGVMKVLVYALIIGICLFVFGELMCSSMNGFMEFIYKDYDLKNTFMNFKADKAIAVMVMGMIFILFEEVILNVYTIKRNK